MKSGQSLAEIFLEVSRHFNDRLALWCRGETLSYGELRSAAARIAYIIHARNAVERGSRIAILSDRSPTAYIGVMGALLAGGAYVPLNPRYPVERNRSILEHSGATVLICDARNRALVRELVFGLTIKPLLVFPDSTEDSTYPDAVYQADISREMSDTELATHFAHTDLAYILFTSGSTGQPKGVPISHSNVIAYVRNATRLSGVSEDDRIIQLADLTFDISVHDMFTSWLNGAALYSVPERATLMAGRFVQEHEITGWFSVPSTAGLLKQAGLLDSESLRSLRFTFFCGEALTGAVAEAWCAAAPDSALFNLYGPTEATVAFSSYRYVPNHREPPSIVPLGEAFPDQRMALFSDNGHRCTGSEIGEICLSGAQVMEGYWQEPELTAAKMFEADGRTWYRTGDMGRHDPVAGYLFAGRVDHQVKLRGYRVELLEIEAAVRAASRRDVVAVIPWPVTADGGATGCVAFVSGAEIDGETIRATCAQTLPDYMVPSHVLFINDMPLNANGKVDYVQLRTHPALSAISR